MPLQFQPMPLKRSLPFDDDDWLFELKYDGFRALAVIEHGRAQPAVTVAMPRGVLSPSWTPKKSAPDAASTGGKKNPCTSG
jgi:hypothetical protein